MIDRNHELPVTRQAGLLAIMCRLEALHLDYPFMGSRMLRDMLYREGITVGRRHITTLRKKMGLEAVYRRTAGCLGAA